MARDTASAVERAIEIDGVEIFPSHVDAAPTAEATDDTSAYDEDDESCKIHSIVHPATPPPTVVPLSTHMSMLQSEGNIADGIAPSGDKNVAEDENGEDTDDVDILDTPQRSKRLIGINFDAM